MKAAIFHGPGQLMTIEETEIASPKRNEVLIRTRASGLCHSDLHYLEGKFSTPIPAILGHEAAGIVDAIGEDVTHVKVGDHVVTCLSVFCGICEFCTSGYQTICNNSSIKMAPGKAKRLTWNGHHLNQFLNISAFAEQMLVHENAVVKIRKDMPFDLAALLGCSVLTGYGAVVHTAKLEVGTTVAVLGCGGVGLSTIHAARMAGAVRIIAIDIDPVKIKMATFFGATDTIDSKDPDMVSKVIEMTQGGVHYAFECIGLKETTEASFAMLRPRGVSTIVGMIPLGTKIELKGFDFLRERRIQGSLMGSNHFRVDIPRLIEFHMQDRMNLKQLVSQKFKLEDINQGFTSLSFGGIARNMIIFD